MDEVLQTIQSFQKIRCFFFHFKEAHVLQKVFSIDLFINNIIHLAAIQVISQNTRPNFWGRFFSNPHTLNERLHKNSAQHLLFWWSWKSYTSQWRITQRSLWQTINETWHAWESNTVTILLISTSGPWQSFLQPPQEKIVKETQREDWREDFRF